MVTGTAEVCTWENTRVQAKVCVYTICRGSPHPPPLPQRGSDSLSRMASCHLLG